MIQLAHMATGLLAGRHCSSPISAVLAGVVMHGMMDVAPHGEVDDLRWELGSVAATLPVLALVFGWRSPLLWAAAGSVLPDLEHVLPDSIQPRGGRPIYPTHRYEWTHSSGTSLAVPAWMQVMLGGAVIGGFVARGLGRRWSHRRQVFADD